MLKESTTKNVLEDNLLKAFAPVHCVQTILGSSVRVRIKNNVVSYNTVWENVYLVLWMVLATMSSSFFYCFYYNTYFPDDMIMFLGSIFGTGIPHLLYILNLLMNRFTQRDNNVEIFAMLQKVDRMLQLDKCNHYTDVHYRLNITVTFITLAGFLTGFAINAAVLLDYPGLTALYGLGIVTVYLDVISGVGKIYYLAVRVYIFNHIIQSYINEYVGNVHQKPKLRTLKNMFISFFVPEVQQSHLNLTHYKWLETLQEMLKAYKIITKLLNFLILNISISAYLWTLIIIIILVVGLLHNAYPLSATITISIWVCSYYLELTLAAIFNDWFIMEVKKTKLLCIRLISCDYDGPYRKVASDIIRTIHYDPPIFIVYGIFVFDRNLPLEIIGVVTSNVFVYLQFVMHDGT